MKRIFSLCLVLALSLSLAACGSEELSDLGKDLEDLGQIMGDAMDAVQDPDTTKTHTNGGVTLTLPASFLDFTGTELAGDRPFIYANETIGILGVEENKAELTELMGQQDAKSYAALIIQLYSLDSEPQQKDGFWYLTYETESDGEKQTYICVIHETPTAFWNLQGYCASEVYPEHAEEIWTYLTSATFE